MASIEEEYLEGSEGTGLEHNVTMLDSSQVRVVIVYVVLV